MHVHNVWAAKNEVTDQSIFLPPKVQGTVVARAGVWIGSAHDCFAMHAAHATRVNRIVREEFRRLHEKPWLGELYRQFRERHPDLADDFPEPPEAVDPTFPLHEVAASAYFVH